MTKELTPCLLLISSPQTSKNGHLPQTDLLEVGYFRTVVSQFDQALKLPDSGSLHPDRQIATVVFSVAAHRAFVRGLMDEIQPGLLDPSQSRFGLKFMGHSVGEMAALIEAGVCDIPTMAWMLNERERITKTPISSGLRLMAAVAGIDADNFEQHLDLLSKLLRDRANIHLANLNAPKQVVVALDVFKGEAEPVLDTLARALSGLHPRARLVRLGVENAFHSAAMRTEEGIYEKIIAPMLNKNNFRDPPEGVVYSPMLPGWIDTWDEAVDIVQHNLTRKVQFTKASKEIPRIPHLVGIVTADYIDTTPDLVRRNIGDGIPIWNIKSRATLDRAIEEALKIILAQAA